MRTRRRRSLDAAPPKEEEKQLSSQPEGEGGRCVCPCRPGVPDDWRAFVGSVATPVVGAKGRRHPESSRTRAGRDRAPLQASAVTVPCTSPHSTAHSLLRPGPYDGKVRLFLFDSPVSTGVLPTTMSVKGQKVYCFPSVVCILLIKTCLSNSNAVDST